MDQLHRSADKLFTEIDHLEAVLPEEGTGQDVELALSVAKRVRRESTILVRLLASLRDQLQP